MPVNGAYVVNQDVSNKNVEKTENTRQTWEKDIHFLLSCIAMSVGLGNVWRFPFAAYENGGGAFLIPYLIVLVLIGRPIYFLDMCLGQFSGNGSWKCFQLITPALKGVAYGHMTGALLVSSYYCSLLALSLFYLFHSFTPNLPWAECAPEWANDPIACVPSKSTNVTNYTVEKYRSSSELWFERTVLKEKTDISDGIGLPDWQLTGYLLLTWILVFVFSARGIKNIGKASYILALFPYVILFALLVRAVTLEGSFKGILYFLRPQWNQLLKPKVWFNAITQCFFSLSVGSGSVIVYASYNKFQHNIYKDVIIITLLDTCTSLVSGIIIFSILGSLAYHLQVKVTQVISSGGTRLAFVTYPDAIAKFDAVPWLFSIMFFFMLYVLGVGSLNSIQMFLYTSFQDLFPMLKRWHVSLFTASLCFFLGLPYLTSGGQFVLTLVDYFGVIFVGFVFKTLQILTVVWWYGLENFCLDVEFMIKRKMGIYWKLCWGILIPLVLILILVQSFSSFGRLKYGIYEFPNNVLIIGWCMFAFGLSQPVVWWLVTLYQKRQLGIKHAFLESFSTKFWRPRSNEDFEEWLKFKSLQKEKELGETRNWLQRKFNFYFNRQTN